MASYNQTNWVDGTTPIDASNLNNMETGISSANKTSSETLSLITDNLTIGTAGSAYSYRRGDMCILRINLNGTLAAAKTSCSILQLSSEYYPSYQIISNYITQEGYPMLIQISTSGDVQIYLNNSTNSQCWLCRQTFVYPARN